MLDPITVISRVGGIARGTTLQKHGISRKRLAREVDAGRVDRIRAGVFATPTLDAAARTAAAHGGALTCGAALVRHGVWVLDETSIHVWVGENGRRHPHPACDCTVHNFQGSTRFGVVDAETALLHLFLCQGDEAFFAAFESALRMRLLTRAARARLRLGLPDSARWLVDIAREDADSGLESLLRLRLHILSIHLDCQVTIPGVGRVDFVIDRRLILEADGKANHDSSSKRHADRIRDAAASALGYETLRFDYAQIVHDWPTVHAAVVAALTRLRDHA